MKVPSLLVAAALLASTALTGPAFAAPPLAETDASGQSALYPSGDASNPQGMRDEDMLAKAKSSNNGKVLYMSGGVAVGGMKAIDAEEHAYNLKILFAAEGEYLANVKVDITDSAHKNILSTTTRGPVLLVKLPPGHYTVNTKAANGSILTQTVEVGDDHLSSYVLRYPAKEAE